MHTQETKDKIRDSRKRVGVPWLVGKRQSIEQIKKRVAGRSWYKGDAVSKETREKMSKSHRGYKWTAEQKEKFLKAMKGRNMGEANPWWKGGRTKDSKGYILIYKPEHPTAKSSGYIYEHRYIIEQRLGRSLDKNEMIHHRNAIKDDNRIENLEIVLRNAHRGKVRCPHCLKDFSIL